MYVVCVVGYGIEWCEYRVMYPVTQAEGVCVWLQDDDSV